MDMNYRALTEQQIPAYARMTRFWRLCRSTALFYQVLVFPILLARMAGREDNTMTLCRRTRTAELTIELTLMRTFKIEKTETQCVVTWWWRDYGMAFFMIFNLATLTGVMALLTYLTLMQSVGLFYASAHACSYVVIGLLSFVLLTHNLFGETKFVLDKNGFKRTYTCRLFTFEKQIDFTDIRHFKKKIRSRGKGQSIYYLRVICQEDSASKSFLPAVRELDDLCDQLNAFLETLKARERGT